MYTTDWIPHMTVTRREPDTKAAPCAGDPAGDLGSPGLTMRLTTVIYVLLVCVLATPLAFLVKSSLHTAQHVDERHAAAAVWSDVVQQMPIASVLLDADTGTIIGWNSGAEELLGMPAELVLGNSYAVLMSPYYRDRHRELFRSGDVRKKLGGHTVTMPCWMYARGNRNVYIPLQATVTGLSTGDRYRFLLLLRDASSSSVSTIPAFPPSEDRLSDSPAEAPRKRDIAEYIDLLRG